MGAKQNRAHGNFVAGLLVLAVVAVLFLLMNALTGRLNTSGASASQGGDYHYGTRTLVGASSEQIGAFAVEYAQAQGQVLHGVPEVLLSRAVTRVEVAELGLGCLPAPGSTQEPPLALVILKGSFGSSAPGGSSLSLEAAYIAYVFDTWSAQPTYVLRSRTGGHFQKALNDPMLPLEGPELPSTCPTEQPRTNSVEYGGIPPTPSVGNSK